MIDLCTLGTGGTIPMPDRALASLYVRVGGRSLVVDCGEGTQVGITRLGWGWQCIDALLITHYHADHCSGLPGLLLSLAKAARTEPVDLYGPPGLTRVVEGLRVVAPQLPFEVRLHELDPAGAVFSAIGLTVRSFPLDHGIPCLGYRFDLPRPRAFLPERARALGVPVQLWQTLQRGGSAIWDGGSARAEDVLGPERSGLSFVYATDTRPTHSIVEAGRGTDLMFIEGMYGTADKLPQALLNHHMIFEESAALARSAGTKRLILTHFSTSLSDPAACLPLAQAVFPAAETASDGMTLTLRWPGR